MLFIHERYVNSKRVSNLQRSSPIALKGLILFVCLFVWNLSSHSRIFHSYGDVTITGEGLQILTYARQSWPLSSESSWACNHLKWSSPRTRETHTYCRAFSCGTATTCFNVLGLSRLGFEYPSFCVRGQGSNTLWDRCGFKRSDKYFVFCLYPSHFHIEIKVV